MDTGAYADNGPRVMKRAISRMIGPYKLRDCKVDVSAVYTNTVPAGSMRSLGGPQTIWALESHMDTIAHRLGDPLAFRMRNLLDRGEALKAGATPIDADLRQGTKIAADGVSWNGAVQKSRKRPGYRGRSFGLRSHAGFRRSGTLLADGSIILGTTEVGKGRAPSSVKSSRMSWMFRWSAVSMGGTDTGPPLRSFHRRERLDNRDGQCRQDCCARFA